MEKKLFPEKPIFKVKKKHAWRDRFIRGIEICALVLVILGTIVWLLFSSKFSLTDFVKNLGNSLKPKIASESARKNLSEVDQIKKLLEGKKLFDINSIEKTKEGDFQVNSMKGETFIFSNEKNLEEQVSTLQTLLAKAKIEGKSLKKVDFRFSKVVVEY